MTRRHRPGLSPLEADEFAALLAPVMATRPSGIVVAVSGGSDSICLMHLIAAVRSSLALPPTCVATVDHGLRAGSRDEAEFVLGEARTLGLPAHRLTWEGPKPERALQERARTARYTLLVTLCKELGASHLLTAHTLDDQAETVLFRLARGSGPAGLAGMRPLTARDGIIHARPLLCVAKSRLVGACEAADWAFVTDPSNTDPRFARARLRTLLPTLAAEGLNAACLSRLASRAARSEIVLESAARRTGAAARKEAEPGTLRFDARMLAAAPTELVIRVFASAIHEVGGQSRAPRLDRLEHLAAAFQREVGCGGPFGRTLGGTMVSVTPDGCLLVRPEGPRRRRSVHPVCPD